MSFVCSNMACSAPENKKDKVYPAAMECPFCRDDEKEKVEPLVLTKMNERRLKDFNVYL